MGGEAQFRGAEYDQGVRNDELAVMEKFQQEKDELLLNVSVMMNELVELTGELQSLCNFTLERSMSIVSQLRCFAPKDESEWFGLREGVSRAKSPSVRSKSSGSFVGRQNGYGFETHAGYPTAAHLKALNQLGVTPIHRRSFGPVQRCVAESAE